MFCSNEVMANALKTNNQVLKKFK